MEESNKALQKRTVTPNAIDKYSLGEEILKLRKSGMSYVRISQEINQKHKDILNGTYISYSQISKYCLNNNTEENRAERNKEVINIYAEHAKILALIEKQIDIIQIFLDDLHTQISKGANVSATYKQMKDLMSDLEKYTGRKQSILTQMQALQEKVYNLQVMSDINQRVLSLLKETNEDVYNEVISKMQVDPMLLMAYAKAKDFGIEQ